VAGSPAFERTCAEIEERTALGRLEARGTVRLALRHAGLDPESADANSMRVVLRRVLAAELAKRGVADAAAICEAAALRLEDAGAPVATDRIGTAARTMDRLGRA
jgi:hypothetical protein